MKRIEATYYVTTPLFSRGSDSLSKAELRPPSLKGLLRFWFRATAWPYFSSIEEVQKKERSLFGSTSGQGKFLISVIGGKGLEEVANEEKWERHGLAYLGYGAVDRGEPVRPYLRQGGHFTVALTLKKGISDKQVEFLVKSLKALGLFGGAGARSRKGFGSLSLVSLKLDGEKGWSPPATIKELQENIKDFLTSLGLKKTTVETSPLPPYTAFSTRAKVYVVEGGRDPLALLDDIGKELLRYRSYGRESGSKHVLPWGEPAEQNFADDHDLILEFLNGLRIGRLPRRVVFGLPHNYFFKSIKQKVTVEPAGREDRRRASPLFIHVHALGNGQHAAVLTLMPAVFLPEGKNIVISGGGRRQTVPPGVDFGVIETFLNRPGLSSKVVWPS